MSYSVLRCVSVVGLVTLLSFSTSVLAAKGTGSSISEPEGKTGQVQKTPAKQIKAPPSPGIKGTTTLPLTTGTAKGYCCIDGKLSKSRKKECLAEQGLFTTDAMKARRDCERMQGWCCVEGALEKATRDWCGKHDGTIYFDQVLAKRKCRPLQGYCCVDGNLAPSTKKACDKRDGRFDVNKAQATRECEKQLVYCCIDGKLTRTTAEQCRRKNLPVYKTKLMASGKCSAAKGYCCAGGRVSQASRIQCLAMNGSFHGLESQAKARCSARGKMKIEKRTPETGQAIITPKRSEPVPGTAPIEKKPGTLRKIGKPAAPTMFGSQARKMRGGDDDSSGVPIGGPGSSPEISVERPVGGERVIAGSSIVVRYSIDDPAPPSVRVELQRHEGGSVTHSHTIHEGAPAVGDRSLPIPLAVPGDDYRIKVTTVGEAIARHDESAGFSISGTFERNLVFATAPYWRIVPGAGEIGELSFGVSCDGRDCAGIPAFNAHLSIAGTVSDTHSFSADSSITYTSTVLTGSEHICGAEVSLILDPENAVDETDETDNTWTRTVTCIDEPAGDLPDLSITGVGVSPHIVAEDDRVEFHYSILNGERFGSLATGRFRVGLRVDGRMENTRDHDSLAPGERVSDTLSWRAECDASFEIVVDIDDDVVEADEANNEYPRERTLFRCAEETLDLRVENFSAGESPAALAGSMRSYNADVVAYFGSPTSVTVRCGIDGGAVFYEEHALSLVDISGSMGRPVYLQRVSFTALLCPADTMFRMYCEVDPDNDIVESDETNNRQQYDVHTYMEEPWDYCAGRPDT